MRPYLLFPMLALMLCGGGFAASAATGLEPIAEPDIQLDLRELRPQRRARFFSAVPDPRLCPAPLCGGWFVSAVNHDLTRCADGEFRESCYVAWIDTRRAGDVSLPGAGRLLLRGRIVRAGSFLGISEKSVGVFRARQVWRSVSGLPLRDFAPLEGDFIRVRNTGIVCVTDPCGSFEERFLNARLRRELHELDLSSVPADREESAQAQRALQSRRGLLAVGKHERFQGTVGPGLRFTANDYYLPLGAER